jgi:hypothetical protein
MHTTEAIHLQNLNVLGRRRLKVRVDREIVIEKTDKHSLKVYINTATEQSASTTVAESHHKLSPDASNSVTSGHANGSKIQESDTRRSPGLLEQRT